MRLTQLFLGLSLVATAACRGGGDDDGDDTPPTDTPPVGEDVEIQAIQSEDMPVGTPVTLKGVVVLAVDSFGARTGDMWVGEPGGGEFSGIKVFGAPLADIGSLVPGDIVTISNAEKDEFALTEDMTGRTVTEIKGAGGGMMSVVKTGTGTLPAPSMVDAKAIEELTDPAARDAEWEKWEGVLINVVNARQLSAVAPFGAGAPDQQAFDATGRVVVESVLAGFPTESVAGVCYSGIVGVGDYFFDYLLLPTATDDLSLNGTGCIAQTTATVAQIQSGTVTGDVLIQNVFVTARDDIPTSKGIWVADALQGAPNNGVFVFTGANLDANLVVGAKVNVIGRTKEFDVGATPVGDKVTEIEQAAVTLLADAPGTPLPLTTATAAQLSDITNGEMFEGVFVSLSTFKVTNAALGNNKVELTANNGDKIVVDDDLFALNTFVPLFQAPNSLCKNLVGVMHVQLNDNIRVLLPRTAADITDGTGCN